MRRHVYEGDGTRVFAKPADRRKCFTGRVFDSPDDFYSVGITSLRETVWCADVVEWVSEYRVYARGEEILEIDHYSGDSSVTVSREVVENALRAYRHSGESPAAYGIDFGVLTTGETALVEANDGYALGAYQIASAPYSEVVLTRWRELVDSAPVDG